MGLLPAFLIILKLPYFCSGHRDYTVRDAIGRHRYSVVLKPSRKGGWVRVWCIYEVIHRNEESRYLLELMLCEFELL